MNPILLKPGSDRRSHVVVLGKPYADVDALSYRDHKPALLTVALDALAELRSTFDVVVCEGAGSPAEINLRDRDLANLGLARAAGLPVVLVGDIDRGGVLAHLAGTVAVLDPADQRHIAGYLINKFRGDVSLLQPGLEWLLTTTGRPCLGVLPWLPGLWLDAEDSLDLDSRPAPGIANGAVPVDGDLLQIAVVRLPRMSNVSDVDPLSAEPGVQVGLTTSPPALLAADLVVVPGTRATVSDLAWLREHGIADVLARRAAAGRPILGICGGLQMLGERIDDPVESRAGIVGGLGLLPVSSTFAAEKTLDLPVGQWAGHRVTGYRIQHGRVRVDGGEAFLDGCRVGETWGTTWHGVFEHDGFRREFLARVAAAAGRSWQPGQVRFGDIREARLDLLGNLIEQHVDQAAVWRLLDGGVPAGLAPLTLGRRPEVSVR